MLNIFTITMTEMFHAELQFVQSICTIVFKTTKNLEPYAVCHCEVQNYMLLFILFLVRSDGLGAQRVLSSDGMKKTLRCLNWYRHHIMPSGLTC